MVEEPLYVLIVDSNEDESRVALHNLQEKFPEVEFVSASEGHQALDIIHERSPDLTITDLQMPGLNGFTLVRKLREDPLTENLPVMILSRARDYDSVRLAVSLGADDFIAKPVDFHILTKRINQLVTRKRSGMELRENHRAYKRRELKVPIEIKMIVTGMDEKALFIESPSPIDEGTSLVVSMDEVYSAFHLQPLNESILCTTDRVRSNRGSYSFELIPRSPFPKNILRETERLRMNIGLQERIFQNEKRPVYVDISCLTGDISGGGLLVYSPFRFEANTGLVLNPKKMFHHLQISFQQRTLNAVVRHCICKNPPYASGLQFTNLDTDLELKIMKWCIEGLNEPDQEKETTE